ncbi:MAG: hypothetical protein EBZ77_03890 [Chitinophagia bacterium]|nr:hypothetical protein [Chitinophagia bacterium]
MNMKAINFGTTLLVAILFLSGMSFGQKNTSRTRPVIPYPMDRLQAPPGMVYIPGGTTIIKYSTSSTDSNSVKKVSLSSYFIDKTEVTNQQYRQFVEWVIDSIAIVHYFKDEDKYFRDAKSTDSNKTTYVRRINWSRVKHSDLFTGSNKEKVKDLLDAHGNIKEDSVVFVMTYLRSNGTPGGIKMGKYVDEPVNVFPDQQIWAKDLTNSQTDILIENYFNTPPYDDYPVVGVNWKQARAFAYWRSVTFSGLSNLPDFMKSYKLTYTLPSEAQWVYAAQQDMRAYSQMIASGAAFTDAAPTTTPAKGDNKDATAATPKGKKGKKGKKGTDSTAVVAAPTPITAPKTPTGNDDPNNAWTATSSSTVDNSAALQSDSLSFFDPVLPDEKNLISSDKAGLTSNFKQDEGEYSGDGSPFTVPVMSYTPNDFGVYNMSGNVAEWTMDAYSPSTFAFVSDVNPVLLYDADSSDTDPMKRKVVRGGSFISNAKALSPFFRDFEMQNTAHCYIGFRCVMAAPEILSNSIATRRKVAAKKASK